MVVQKQPKTHGSSDGSGPGTGGSPTGVGPRDYPKPITGPRVVVQKPYDDISRGVLPSEGLQQASIFLATTKNFTCGDLDISDIDRSI